MEDDFNERHPIEHDLNRICPQWKTTLSKDKINETTSMEDNLIGRQLNGTQP